MVDKKILGILRKSKRTLFRYREIIFKALSLLISTKQINRTNGRNLILVTGELGNGGGPFTFLSFFCLQMRGQYALALIFPHTQVKPFFASFCRSNSIALYRKPLLSDTLDLLYTLLLVLWLHPSHVLINAGTFGRNLHLLALNTPTIYYNHSIWHPTISEREKWLLQTFLKPPRRIVTVSKAAYKSLEELFLRRSKLMGSLSWIHNALADRYVAPVYEKSKTIVLTLGSVAWYKNPELWLRIAKRILADYVFSHEVEFWWGGRGDLLTKMQRFAASEKRIKFLGFIREPDSIFAQSSIYFQPSKFESFGLGVCEAMMFALPCVVTDCGGVTELVRDTQTGFIVNESDEDGIIQKIVLLIRSQTLREDMGKRARIRFLEEFGAASWRKGMVELLNRK